MDSDTSNRPLPEELERIVVEELDSCRTKVIDRIAKTRKLTDAEVYQAGVALEAVVERAQAYMTEVNARMSSSADSVDGVDETLQSIQKMAKHQQHQVAGALENLAGIGKAGRQIREMAGASRLLALNARVESARFGGEGGRAFNVIADEMRELSVSVETTNTMVRQLAAKLEKALPSIQEQTLSMTNSIEHLVREMEDRNQRLQTVFRESIQAGGEALDGVLGSARESLSHLQFQDLMIQDLEGIERIVRKSHAAVTRILSPDTQLDDKDEAFLGTMGSDLEDTGASDSKLVSGNVLLF